MASFIAAASSRSSHGISMIPFFIYYSMFGFQRIGDLIWAAGDMRCRGFLLGGTAGRTTLAGEGLQHRPGLAALVAEHQRPAGIPPRQQPVQLLRRQNLWRVQPPGLLGGLDGDRLQARHIGVVGVGAAGDRQPHPPGPQFRRLLDNCFQPPPLDQCDDQVQVRPEVLRPQLLLQPQPAAALGHLHQPRRPFPVAAVEQRHHIAHRLPHHRGEVPGLVRRGGDLGGHGQGVGNEKPDHDAEVSVYR